MSKFLIVAKRPTAILKAFELLCTIVIMGVLGNNGKYSLNGTSTSVYNGSNQAWNYGMGVGVIMFLMALLSLVYEIITTIRGGRNKVVVIIDLIVSALLALLGLVAFGYLADQWRKTDSTYKSIMSTLNADAARAGIAFYFFSFLLWLTLAVLSAREYRQGPASADEKPSHSEYAAFVDDAPQGEK
eukprot:m.420692 g.420692  ORF g.420692 m.420692 type:complete len:186 (+) comp56639_c0_seq1:49-606(+)